MKKRADIELLRVLSTFGIVWFHSGAQGQEFAYSGLIVFLIVSMYLGGKSGAGDMPTVRRRAERLIVPWLVWFVFYSGLNVFRSLPVFAAEHGLIAGVLAGPSIHLWYMPFIFICLLTLDVVKGHVSQSAISIGSGVLALLVIAATPLWRSPSMELISPLPQWAHASAAIFIGVFVLYLDKISRVGSSLLILAMLACVIYMIPYSGIGIPYLIGLVAVLVVASRLLEVLSVDVSFVSECTLGVYFVHVFVLLVFFKFGLFQGAFLPVAVFVIATLAVMALRKLLPGLAKYWS